MTFKQFLFLHGYSLVGNPGEQEWYNRSGKTSDKDLELLNTVYKSGLLQSISVYSRVNPVHPDLLSQLVERHEMGD